MEKAMRQQLMKLRKSILGPDRNDQLALLLKKLSSVALQSHAHFRDTGGRDLHAIVDFEHQADVVVGEIHELLDNSFILRFDIADSMRLTDELDDVIDGLRKVALHIDAYRKYLSVLPPEANELLALGGDMVIEVDKLVSMLSDPQLVLARVREGADRISEMEGHADTLVSDYERQLVERYSAPGSDVLAFIAWHQLFHLLEQITDDANHCARQILSLARKEA